MNLSDEYEPETSGTLGTDTFRVFFKRKLPNASDPESAQIYISPFHDIPIYSELAPNIHRMIVRMPRWSVARMEICKTEPFNPIRQDSSRQLLRYYDNIFPYHGVLWNSGSFPQTWEMLSYMHPDFKDLKGDNGLLDVLEIGSRIHKTGTVLDVKILGAIVLIDQDHLDWKIFAIDINDPLASKIDNIVGIEEHMPGLLDSTLDFYRFYKTGMGHTPITFGYDKIFLDKQIALDTIVRSHAAWQKLIKNEVLVKQSKDSADFKLFNTQCLESNREYQRNSKEAEALIENLKMLVINRPIESMAQAPSIQQIERVIYLKKQLILNNLSKAKEEENLKRETEIKREQTYFDNLGKFLQDNFYTFVLPASLLSVALYFSTKKSMFVKV